MFEPFAQGSASTWGRFGGTGLGLSITASLVGLMGGTIALDSEPGQGSRFTVTLPLPHASAAEVAAADAVQDDAPTPLRVALLVSDADRSQRLQKLAQALGWQSEQASDVPDLARRAQDAQQKALPIDVVLVDGSEAADPPGVLQALNKLAQSQRPSLVLLGEHGETVPGSSEAERQSDTWLELLHGAGLFNAVNGVLQAAGARAAAARLMSSTMRSTDDLYWLPQLRLLVVDDSELNLEVARKVLELEGAEVVTCTSGAAALQALQEVRQPFDAALLDVQMPGMDGLQLARAVRSLLGRERLPLVALSAGVLEGERAAALAAGMSEFLAKPLEPRRLVAALRQHVLGRRAEPVPVWPRDSVDRARSQPAAGLGIEGIADAHITTALLNDRPLLLSLIERLLSDLDRLAATAPQALPARLHKLRGSAQVVGAMALAGAAQQLEMALRQSGAAVPPSLRQTLAGRVSELCQSCEKPLRAENERLATLRASESAQAEHSAAPAPFAQAELMKLRALLDGQSKRAAGLVQQQAQPLLQLLGPARMGRLRRALTDFDFHAALAELDGVVCA